ncbi:PKD domain protein [Mariniflexile rhizosphaerae]|uniref:PKD domain-containing protein n=1 Tax=unclassified Mariniflexile TaxID=2643887 RepID=UPI000CAE0035|nr:PKD domain-containing protein [Mariniflexile sp. TRM1-10]AXP82352.1 PKD domain protein [Mariniflexile sp. TRM1-10]PLB20452.1 MAG: PKD domain-containing protein [Flavobacteriaceae bacterium FS1-H7996/R]
MNKKYYLALLLCAVLTISFFGLNKIIEVSIKNSDFVLPPTIDFSFNNNNACSDTPITFTPIVTGDAPFTYLWNFGSGKTSTNSNPTFAFTALGCGFQDNDVTLTVTDANGISTSLTKTVSVQQKPDLKFVNLNAPSGSAAPFEKCGDNNTDLQYTINVGNDSASASCIASYNVDWGDGTTETNVTFPRMHTYTKLGAFNMIITGIGTSGCNNAITYVIKNSNNPIGALIAPGNTTNLCTPVSPMDFAIGSWASNPSDTNYRVNYGDGTTANYTQAQLESSPYFNSANPPASQDFPIPHTFTRFNCPSGNTVTLTITTSCGSTFLTAGPIIILDVPTISFNVNSIVCANTSVYFNNTTVAGFTNDCSTVNVYTWDFGDGSTPSRAVNPSHVYRTPGNYTVTLSAETPCGKGISATKTICVEPILEPNFTFDNACASTPLQITNTTNASLGCGAETYIWDIISYSEAYCGEEPESWNFTNGTYRNSKNPVISFTTPGIYYLRLTTRNSCGIDRSITKRIDVKKPPVTTLEPLSNFCQSASIFPVGTVEETCSPSSEITYLWSFPGGTPSSSTLLNPGKIDYSASGNYTVTFSVTNSCGTTTKNQNFSVDLVLSPIISPKAIDICSGQTFQVRPTSNGTDNVPSGTTYTWNTPVITPAGAISGASEQSSPRTNISQTLTNNTNAPATVTYTVSPISGSCPGPDFTITVTVNPLIKVTPNIVNATCFGSDDSSINIDISGGIPFSTGNPYTITWTGPNGFSSSNEDIFNLEPGNYTLNITDDGKCPYSNTFRVTEPGLFRFSGSKNDISCFGLNDGRINLTTLGGTPPYNYTWVKVDDPTFTATTEDLSNLEPGDYEVTITEVNNCDTLRGSYTIIEPPLLEVSLANPVDTILCYGSFTGKIDVTAKGGRPNYRWSWTGPNGFRSSLQNLNNIQAGTYNLTVSDNSGCTKNLQVVVPQNPEIKLDYTVKEIICYNDDSGAITINGISGGVPPYEPLVWSNLGTGMVQNNLSHGTYVVTVTDALDCVVNFPITLANAPIFDINPTVKNVSCHGENDGSIKLNLVGGENPISLVWDDGSTSGNERNNIGPGTYSVTITDAKDCVIQETFTIIEPLPLKLIGDVTDALDCDDVNSGAIDLEVTGGTLPLSFSWSNGSRIEDLSNIPPGVYTVTITDANNCKLSETWEVKRFAALESPFEVITNFNCETKYVDQTFIAKVKGGIPPYQLSWSSGIISGANNEIMRTDTNGLVILTVTDSFGCVEEFSIQVETPILDDARFTTDSFGFSVYNLYSVYDPITFTNGSIGDFTNISWDFGDGNFSNEENPEHIYVKEGTYTIKQTVTYPFGCEYYSETTLVIEKGYSIIMPNAFTPNKDGLNDYFAPVFIGLNNMTLHIYDTWGGIIYAETGENIRGWDGKIKGIASENGNYYYKLTAKTFYNHTITREGSLVLIK